MKEIATMMWEEQTGLHRVCYGYLVGNCSHIMLATEGGRGVRKMLTIPDNWGKGQTFEMSHTAFL